MKIEVMIFKLPTKKFVAARKKPGMYLYRVLKVALFLILRSIRFLRN